MVKIPIDRDDYERAKMDAFHYKREAQYWRMQFDNLRNERDKYNTVLAILFLLCYVAVFVLGYFAK